MLYAQNMKQDGDSTSCSLYNTAYPGPVHKNQDSALVDSQLSQLMKKRKRKKYSSSVPQGDPHLAEVIRK